MRSEHNMRSEHTLGMGNPRHEGTSSAEAWSSTCPAWQSGDEGRARFGKNSAPLTLAKRALSGFAVVLLSLATGCDSGNGGAPAGSEPVSPLPDLSAAPAGESAAKTDAEVSDATRRLSQQALADFENERFDAARKALERLTGDVENGLPDELRNRFANLLRTCHFELAERLSRTGVFSEKLESHCRAGIKLLPKADFADRWMEEAGFRVWLALCDYSQGDTRATAENVTELRSLHSRIPEASAEGRTARNWISQVLNRIDD